MDERTHRLEEGLAHQAGPIRGWLTRYFGRTVRDQAEVEDLVQDAFARMVSRDGGGRIENINGYVLKTASSIVADRARRRSARRADLHVPFDAELHAGEEIDPERVLSGREELDAAAAALLALPERTRTVFILRRLEGYRYAEIAAHLGISVSAVEKHLVRALGHLAAERAKRDAS
ncbi:MAG TPA: RNA polymerase sigma factor [Allosphingosinicella sp.]|jgi:RNA polymerase sigma-70 factor (ECF subfamily)